VQEASVGPFRADILCKDNSTGKLVLVENQLERTDHMHLGQLMTYAAGLSVVTVVWVAARFTDEHWAALDWLNEITAEDINFFGLEVELWRIGDSAPAPKFNVVSQPNDWSRRIKASSMNEDKPGVRYKIGAQLTADPLNEGDWPRQFAFLSASIEALGEFVATLEGAGEDD
jgi:hypothetical protein